MYNWHSRGFRVFSQLTHVFFSEIAKIIDKNIYEHNQLFVRSNYVSPPDHHDMTVILLKVALIIMTLTLIYIGHDVIT
jgi:hypothetical protein